MRYLNSSEAIEMGILMEINRRLLHPRGLALEIRFDPDNRGTDDAIFRVQDHRHDEEGMYFEDFTSEDVDKGRVFDVLQAATAASRLKALGYIVQPLEEDPS